ncbi:hypothetical protein E2C01_051264 [Portunus trituberculatus]|uniref:Ionotropic glutamate receptor C-terminal domain-containing protein n=1 Tax=Portunus trituberculatus TaxID=210409 RepID=A0A5B7GJ41_PORTR|nr:hypothetical protein [Portunus trituberculatus]
MKFNVKGKYLNFFDYQQTASILQDVNFGLGPFSIDAARNEVIEFTWPISFVVVKVFAGRAVWIEGNVWWWERLILGVWMLMTLVLMRSYESTLMSLLAVRHLPQPYQTLRAVLDDHSVGMVWHKQGAIMQAIMDATSGIFIEVKASEEEGRLTKLPLYAYASIVDQIISHAKVIIDYDVITTVVRNDHFSETGRCDFYFGHERILSHPISLISQKDSPLIPVFNKR